MKKSCKDKNCTEFYFAFALIVLVISIVSCSSLLKVAAADAAVKTLDKVAEKIDHDLENTGPVNRNIDIIPNSDLTVRDREFLTYILDTVIEDTDQKNSYTLAHSLKSYVAADKVFVHQTINDSAALVYIANFMQPSGEYKDRYSNLALLIENEALFYNGQVKDIKNNEEIKQVGLYHYTTVENGVEKARSVPVVMKLVKRYI